MTTQYTQPTSEQRQELLKITGELECLVKDPERQKRTTLSRSRTWQMERLGSHPKRVVLGNNSVAWVLSDLLHFIYQQTDNNKSENEST